MPSPAATARFAPHLDELPRLVEFIDAFADSQHLSPADTIAITLASEELFTNTLHHSKAIEIQLSLQRDPGHTVTIVYTDDAAAFDPTQQSEPDTSLPAELRPVGGLGLHIIRKSMQSFTYQRDDGRNRVTFVRTLMR